METPNLNITELYDLNVFMFVIFWKYLIIVKPKTLNASFPFSHQSSKYIIFLFSHKMAISVSFIIRWNVFTDQNTQLIVIQDCTILKMS